MSQVPPNPPLLEYGQGRGELKEIAQRQRILLFCILGQITLYVLEFFTPFPVNLILALGAFGVAITATVFVFMLATKIYGTSLGIVFGVLTLIPCIGLFALLTVNGKATAILKKNGIAVGLMGATVPD